MPSRLSRPSLTGVKLREGSRAGSRRGQPGPRRHEGTGTRVMGQLPHPPGDDAGHAMLTIAGAVDAQAGQEVKQMG